VTAGSCEDTVGEWWRKHLHLSIPGQCRWLNRKLRGHYGYYGVSHNLRVAYVYTYWVYDKIVELEESP